MRTDDLSRRASTRSGSSISSAASARRCAAAAANAEGFEATLDDVRVSVAAEVARNYFELRGLQQQLAVAERSLTNQRETLRLTEVRRDAGFGEEQDVASAAARVAGDRGEHAAASRRRWPSREHRLAVLIGVAAGRARRRPGAARLSAAGQGAAARRSGDAAAPAARRARGRAAAGRRDGARRRRRGGPVSAHHR